MIVYQKTKENFTNDLLSNQIEKIVEKHILSETGKRVAPNELKSFKNSLSSIGLVLQDHEIPEQCGISIEYHIPQTAKRIDLMITGRNDDCESVVVIELKQWEKAELTKKDGLVKTYFQSSKVETTHPSYQAWSYAALLESFNSTIQDDNVSLYPCAYLHNYKEDQVIRHPFYDQYLQKAPVFLQNDALKLRTFIKQYIKYGDRSNLLFRIDNSEIKPSRSLADRLSSLLQGNQEFIMIDDQKVVYENALELAIHSNQNKEKNVLIVEGGAGTGKSVVAINLLVELISRGIMSKYVTKTSAPREVYFEKLMGDKTQVELKSLFVGSGTFIKSAPNTNQVLLVDEAHRLTQKTGFLKRGENQIQEIIDASWFSVFFIDEDQRVHISDYGDIKTIEKFAKMQRANVSYLSLSSQFRCNGSDGYVAWLDNTLQIRETANTSISDLDFEFDFQVFQNPRELQQTIYEKNKLNNKSRLVAGYCWDWKSKKDSSAEDIVFLDYDFNMKWNLSDYGGKWIIDPESVSEVGCIHTAQGLEVDYIGVIIGEDLMVRNGIVQVDPSKRSKMDRSIFGWKKMVKESPNEAKQLLESIIKNTYRTLMTRGMKGCYIYCVDAETSEYFQQRLEK